MSKFLGRYVIVILKYKKKLTSLHCCVRARSHTFKIAEISLLGHIVIERRTGCPYKPMWRDPI